jgi:hypothetical protein
MPVVRPKTAAEIEAGLKSGDTNPFEYVPFGERGAITDGSIGAVLYEFALTECYSDKSWPKLRPLLLIWFRDAPAVVSPLAMEKPFLFQTGAVQVVTEEKVKLEEQHD